MAKQANSESLLAEVSYLLDGATMQDSLLQSYRGFNLTFQSIFLAIGTGLSIAVLSFDDYRKSLAALVFLVVLAAVGIAALSNMRKVIVARGKDVDYWHRRILKKEQSLPDHQRWFTCFKKQQNLRRSDSIDTKPLIPNDPPIEDKEIFHLVQLGLGHTRKKIDVWLGRGLFALWLSLLTISTVAYCVVHYSA